MRVGSFVLLLAGCATVQMGEFTLDKDYWERHEKEVKARASFELKCPPEQLTLTVLASHGGLTDTAKQIGVTGCDHRLVYVNNMGSWVLNSSDETAPKK
jgi:hypothetical protein